MKESDFEEERNAAPQMHLSAGFAQHPQNNRNLQLAISREQYFRQKAIRTMASAISEILIENQPSIYLYGSCVLNDFRLGWSDIDILVLTQKRISQAQAEKLVMLRQELEEGKPDDPCYGKPCAIPVTGYYRSFEGGMLTLSAFLSKEPDCVVYWGTSGQRITDTYAFDSFCMAELLQNGVLLYGTELRDLLTLPEYSDLYQDVKRHYEGIRQYAQTTDRSLYSFGWLLDIARGIYTLRKGAIISKTEAAQWALDNNLCPVPDTLKIALKVRKNPLAYQKDSEILNYAEALGPDIQKFADMLEKEIKSPQRCNPAAQQNSRLAKMPDTNRQ